MTHTSEQDIELLKAAYRGHKRVVTLSDGREIARRKQYKFNSCNGCVLKHSFGCYCADGEVWVTKKTYEDEQDSRND